MKRKKKSKNDTSACITKKTIRHIFRKSSCDYIFENVYKIDLRNPYYKSSGDMQIFRFDNIKPLIENGTVEIKKNFVPNKEILQHSVFVYFENRILLNFIEKKEEKEEKPKKKKL